MESDCVSMRLGPESLFCPTAQTSWLTRDAEGTGPTVNGSNEKNPSAEEALSIDPGGKKGSLGREARNRISKDPVRVSKVHSTVLLWIKARRMQL